MLTALQRFEQAIARYDLALIRIRKRSVEHMKFPPMAVTYWNLTGHRDNVPATQQMFAAAVLHQLPYLAACDEEAARARAYRAWVSLVQQHHFELVLAEHFQDVRWDAALDMEQGIDIVVTRDGRSWGFAVWVMTELGAMWRGRKQGRHGAPPFPTLDVNIQPWRNVRGRFWLYDPRDIGEVYGFMGLAEPRRSIA